MEKKINFPLVMLLAFVIKSIAISASFSDALIVLALTSLYAFFHFIEQKREPVANKDILEKIAELEKQSSIVKDRVSGIGLANNFKRN